MISWYFLRVLSRDISCMYFQMYEAKFTDGGDCYEIHLVMAKPGTPSKLKSVPQTCVGYTLYIGFECFLHVLSSVLKFTAEEYILSEIFIVL